MRIDSLVYVFLLPLKAYTESITWSDTLRHMDMMLSFILCGFKNY